MINELLLIEPETKQEQIYTKILAGTRDFSKLINAGYLSYEPTPEHIEELIKHVEQRIKPTENSEQPAKPENEKSPLSGEDKQANEKTLGSNNITTEQPKNDLKSKVDTITPDTKVERAKTPANMALLEWVEQKASRLNVVSTKEGLKRIDITIEVNEDKKEIKKKKYINIGDPLRVLSKFYNVDDPARSGIWIELEDQQKATHVFAVQSYADDYLKDLKSRHYQYNDRDKNKVNRFIYEAIAPHINEYQMTGWRNIPTWQFISPLGSLCSPHGRMSSLDTYPAFDGFSLQVKYGWLQEVYPLIKDNDMQLFLIFHSLGGGILDYTCRANSLIHLNGKSGSGKSTQCNQAGAMWGNPLCKTKKVVKSWHSTGSALKEMALNFNNTCLVLDEFTQATEECLDYTYSLIIGEPRNRSVTWDKSQGDPKSTLNFLSNGETSLKAKFKEFKIIYNPGQAVRFITMPFVENTDSYATKEINDKVNNLSGKYYGMGLFMIRWIMDNKTPDIIENDYKQFKTIMQKELNIPLTNQMLRVLDYFTNNALAGYYFNKAMGINSELSDSEQKLFTIRLCNKFFNRLVDSNYFEDTDPDNALRQKLYDLFALMERQSSGQDEKVSINSGYTECLKSPYKPIGIVNKDSYMIYQPLLKNHGITAQDFSLIGIKIADWKTSSGVKYCKISKDEFEKNGKSE